jgi:orotate phosphoribosyltransferase
MEAYQKKFAESIADSGALFFGEFELKDGRETPYFFNAGKINDGRSGTELDIAYAEMMVRERFADKTDIVYGPSYKGIPIAKGITNQLWLNHNINVQYEYDRKEAKTHGEATGQAKLMVNGVIRDGKRLFVTDDVWTSGKTKYEAVERIKAEAEKNGYNNVRVIGMGIALDREQVKPVYDESISSDLPNKERIILGERGDEAIASFVEDTGIPVVSIVGIRDVMDHLYQTSYPLLINGTMQPMDEGTFSNFQKYMKIYGTKR